MITCVLACCHDVHRAMQPLTLRQAILPLAHVAKQQLRLVTPGHSNCVQLLVQLVVLANLLCLFSTTYVLHSAIFWGNMLALDRRTINPFRQTENNSHHTAQQTGYATEILSRNQRTAIKQWTGPCASMPAGI